MRPILTLLALFAVAASVAARINQVKGTVLDAAGRPASGAQVWTDDPRLGARADGTGAFSLTGSPPGGKLYAAAGLAFGEAVATGGRAVIRLEKSEPIDAAAKAALGEELLAQAASQSRWKRPALFALLARVDPARARRAIRDDSDRSAVLGALARRDPAQGEALAAEVEQMANNFERCRAANHVALALERSNPTAARKAFLAAHAVWESKSVGGNDLLFPYAALSARFLPEKADAIVADADGWARLHPQPHHERTVLALALGAVDLRRADALLKQLPSPHDGVGYARLAAALAPSEPTAALSYLQEAVRRGQGNSEFVEERDRALRRLLPGLARSNPEAALKLVKEPSAPSLLTKAWRLRLDPSLRPKLATNLRSQMEQSDLDHALVLAEICGSIPEGRELPGLLRTKYFAHQAKEAVPVDTVTKFVRLLAPLDPASARAAIERALRETEGSERRPSLLPLLGVLDPLRARTLVDALADEEQATVARGVLGAFLRLERFPLPLE